MAPNALDAERSERGQMRVVVGTDRVAAAAWRLADSRHRGVDVASGDMSSGGTGVRPNLSCPMVCRRQRREHVGERQIDAVRFVDSYQLRLAAPMRIECSDEIAFSSGLITLPRPRFDTGLADLTGAIKWFANPAT